MTANEVLDVADGFYRYRVLHGAVELPLVYRLEEHAGVVIVFSYQQGDNGQAFYDEGTNDVAKMQSRFPTEELFVEEMACTLTP